MLLWQKGWRPWRSEGAVASVNANAANTANAGAGGTDVTNEQSVANGRDGCLRKFIKAIVYMLVMN